MVIGILETQLILHGLRSLKDKRRIVKSLIGRLQTRFNLSIAEVDHQDSKQCAVLGLAVVANDSQFVDQQLDTILNFIRADGRFYLGQIEREVFHS